MCRRARRATTRTVSGSTSPGANAGKSAARRPGRIANRAGALRGDGGIRHGETCPSRLFRLLSEPSMEPHSVDRRPGRFAPPRGFLCPDDKAPGSAGAQDRRGQDSPARDYTRSPRERNGKKAPHATPEDETPAPSERCRLSLTGARRLRCGNTGSSRPPPQSAEHGPGHDAQRFPELRARTPAPTQPPPAQKARTVSRTRTAYAARRPATARTLAHATRPARMRAILPARARSAARHACESSAADRIMPAVHAIPTQRIPSATAMTNNEPVVLIIASPVSVE